MHDLLLSDLHLPPEASPLREAFLRFCDGPARSAQRVFILGDLFEAWIGDDVGLTLYPEEVTALRRLSDSGVQVYYLHGNRDFLLGKGFDRATGAIAMTDPVIVDIAGIPTLLSHGDGWCTADVGYQRWRRFSRNPIAQWLFRHLPRSRRMAIAERLRKGSRDATRGKSAEIMDVEPAAIETAFARHGVKRIIHGHTHRPASHQHRGGERIVLPDWRVTPVLRCELFDAASGRFLTA